MKTLLCMSLISAGFMLSVGCAETSTSTVEGAEIVNTHCPIMGEEIDPETATTVEWNGKKVAFCCPPCKDEWAEMTDAERQEALDKAESGELAGHGHDHDEHGDHGEHDEHGDHGEHEEHADHGDHHTDDDHDQHEAGDEQHAKEPAEEGAPVPATDSEPPAQQ